MLEVNEKFSRVLHSCLMVASPGSPGLSQGGVECKHKHSQELQSKSFQHPKALPRKPAQLQTHWMHHFSYVYDQSGHRICLDARRQTAPQVLLGRISKTLQLSLFCHKLLKCTEYNFWAYILNLLWVCVFLMALYKGVLIWGFNQWNKKFHI